MKITNFLSELFSDKKFVMKLVNSNIINDAIAELYENDFDIMKCKILQDPYYIEYINENNKFFNELCNIAIKQDIFVHRYISKTYSLRELINICYDNKYEKSSDKEIIYRNIKIGHFHQLCLDEISKYYYFDNYL